MSVICKNNCLTKRELPVWREVTAARRRLELTPREKRESSWLRLFASRIVASATGESSRLQLFGGHLVASATGESSRLQLFASRLVASDPRQAEVDADEAVDVHQLIDLNISYHKHTP